MTTPSETLNTTGVSVETVLERRKAFLHFLRTTKKQRCTEALVKGQKVCALGAAGLVAGIDLYIEPPYPAYSDGGDDIQTEAEYQIQRQAYLIWDQHNDATYEAIKDYYALHGEEVPGEHTQWTSYIIDLNDSDNLSFRKIAAKLEEKGFLNVSA